MNLSLREAQLFRMLSDFFGGDRVVLRMSLLAVCGGDLPAEFADAETLQRYGMTRENLMRWAKKTPCLFTLVDRADEPKMVIEFFSGFEKGIDPQEEEHQRLVSPILQQMRLPYLTISDDEFAEMIDPSSSLDLFTLIRAKFREYLDGAV